MARAFVDALVASGAFRVVNRCDEIVHGDSTCFAVLFAQAARDTADVAFQPCVLAVVDGHTAYPVL